MTKLYNVEETIKQAVEAGYWSKTDFFLCEEWQQELLLPGILQDPTFWQALGKARGWNRRAMVQKYPHPEDVDVATVDGAEEWLYHSLRYFETVLSGGDLTNFWQSLP